MYFYTEPGVGIRYFLGGNIFHDLDFWSRPTVKLAKSHTSLESLWKALGRPNLYLSYSSYKSIGISWGFNYLAKFASELNELPNMPWVKDVIKFRGATFLVTNEK